VELAHRKLAVGGTMAFVLPLTAMSGSSWEGVRSLWAQTYHDIAVVTIAESRVSTRSFSADTNMAECLVVAKKGPGGTEPRAVFAVLNAQPQNTVEAELIANAIHQAASSGVRKLEDGPFGGTAIRLGQTEAGTIVDCPIPDEGGWPLVGLSDITLGQTAFQLSVGRLFIEGMSHSPVVSIPVAKVRDVCARLGPHDLDITGSGVKADGLPQGPFEKIGGAVPGAAFPSLWNHDSASERMLVVRPDSHLRIRDVGGTVPQALQDRAALRWATASRVHYNREFQFNSQSLVVAFTEQRSIGRRCVLQTIRGTMRLPCGATRHSA
jgi:hypothetical protein